MFKIIKSEKGLSLIELLVSIAILSIIIVPLSNMFLMAVKIDTKAKDKLIAVNLAQNVVEASRENEKYEINGNYSINGNIISQFKRYEILENQANPDSYYSAIITIEEDKPNEVKIYSIPSDSKRSSSELMQNLILTITDNYIEYDGKSVGYTKNAIKIECYDQDENYELVKNFKIKIKTEKEITIHIVKMISEGFSNNNDVSIDIIQGRAKIIDGLYCRVRSDNSFDTENNQNRLLKIKANISKNSETVTELNTIKKVK
ncbi:prepilin-type N-terminal cleavage/methylation domain-containing protein [Caminicella sporogenes DSM 14501]|uniref:Prepilin-type N-terminal cleavage/methylation domain-containing protein n=1 Tax=Caminicella sporogenes DSM 14501 TaxID=1121266 RepID=A0A1M6LNW5_9FIRM|nr:prepilin-type N-terminal cleavage/methylation domain-containing protein [Caminicella sporogenes]RKD27894.1 hypothetical protein BET04_02200 [Caminicella sporogenes]SHJ72752.1 prepilin-type N-terminal cleavage/methylation domain-containing protein [Caminicella sporogenes DSM 14501]